MVEIGSIYKHLKTGASYRTVGFARLESTGEMMIMYEGVETGVMWVRPKAEFIESRFLKNPKFELGDLVEIDSHPGSMMLHPAYTLKLKKK